MVHGSPAGLSSWRRHRKPAKRYSAGFLEDLDVCSALPASVAPRTRCYIVLARGSLAPSSRDQRRCVNWTAPATRQVESACSVCKKERTKQISTETLDLKKSHTSKRASGRYPGALLDNSAMSVGPHKAFVNASK